MMSWRTLTPLGVAASWSMAPYADSPAKAVDVPATLPLGVAALAPLMRRIVTRAALHHAGQHLPDRRGEPEYREFDGGPEVLDRGFEHRLQEIGAGHGAELHRLDGAEVLGRPFQRPREGVPVAYVRDVAPRRDAVGGEILLQCLELGPVAGDEGDGEALAAELPGHGGPEPGACADNGDSHVFIVGLRARPWETLTVPAGEPGSAPVGRSLLVEAGVSDGKPGAAPSRRGARDPGIGVAVSVRAGARWFVGVFTAR